MSTTHIATNRFSGRCDHCIYPIVREIEGQYGDFVKVTCPGCGTQGIKLERLYGVYANANCDARCQYALGPLCECACGGANHQRGYIPLTLTGEVEAGKLAKYRRTHANRKAGAEKRAATKAAAKAERMAAAIANTLAGISDAATFAALSEGTDLSAFAGLDDYATSTILDIRSKLYANGRLSEAQVAFVGRLITQGAARAERSRKIEAERADSIPAPVGRVEVVGTVVAVKEQWSDYAGGYGQGGYVRKLVIRDDRKFAVWVTEPRGLTCERGDRVRLTATLEQSRKDPTFAFGKRPSKASKIGHVESTIAVDLPDALD